MGGSKPEAITLREGVRYENGSSTIIAGVATCDERLDTSNWYQAVDIIQVAFRDGRLT